MRRAFAAALALIMLLSWSPAALAARRSAMLDEAAADHQANAHLAVARKAQEEGRSTDCFIEFAATQQLAQAYFGISSEKGMGIFTLLNLCFTGSADETEIVEQLKQRLAASEAEDEGKNPRSLEILRALMLATIGKPDGELYARFYLQRMQAVTSELDPRYTAALMMTQLTDARDQGADRATIARRRLDSARRYLLLQRKIFGPRHPMVADAIAFVAQAREKLLDEEYGAAWTARGGKDDPTAEKRMKRKIADLWKAALRAQIRVRGEDAPETIAIAKELSEKTGAGPSLEMLRRAAEATARRAGPDAPSTLMAEFDMARADFANPASQAALRSIAKRVTTLKPPLTAYDMYLLRVLPLSFNNFDIAKPEAERKWTVEIDQMLEHIDHLETLVEGRSSYGILLQQMLHRSRNSVLRPRVPETAANLFAAVEERRKIAERIEHRADGASNDLKSSYASIASALWDASATPTAADADLAFAALQSSQFGSASGALARSAARRAAGETSRELPALVDRREALRETYTRLDRQFAVSSASAGGTAGGGFDYARFLAIRKELDGIDDRLRREFPGYFSFIQPEPMSIGAVQRLLSPDQALILLRDDGERTHVIAINRGGHKWARASHAKPGLTRQVQRLMWDLRVPVELDPKVGEKWTAEDGNRVLFSRKIAWQLYRELIEPVADIIAGRQHIFLVQGGMLSGLPLSVLVTKPPTGDDADPAALRDTAWFIDQHTLSILPSVQSLALSRTAPADLSGGAQHRRFIGFGDPVLEGEAISRGVARSVGPRASSLFRQGRRSVDGKIDLMQLRLLNRLPGTAHELGDISRIFGPGGSTLFLAADATEDKVKHTNFDNALLIAFATHGVLAGEIDGATEPGLVFTPPASPSADDDGYLTATEVSALRMDADWVLLSACNTAGGGLSGLARAFFYAGARSLLVSHWPVRDDVASRLTVDAIRRQRADGSTNAADALREAMRAIRDDRSQDGLPTTFAHPNAWAPFSLVGDLVSIGSFANDRLFLPKSPSPPRSTKSIRRTQTRKRASDAETSGAAQAAAKHEPGGVR